MIGADFASIESRVLAWVAREQWKLDAYRRSMSPAIRATSRIARPRAGSFVCRPGSYTKEFRNGTSAKPATWRSGTWAASELGGSSSRIGLPISEVETFKTEWRAAHPAIKRFWYDIDRAAWTAVRERGRIIRCGPVAFKATARSCSCGCQAAASSAIRSLISRL